MWMWWCAAALAGLPLALPAGDEVQTETLIADELAASGSPEDAIAAYQRLVDEPDGIGARAAWRIGELQLSSNEADRATWTFQDAAKRLEAYQQPFLLGEGMARFSLGQYTGAARAFAQVEDQALADAAALFEALALASAEQTDGALTALSRLQGPAFTQQGEALRTELLTPGPQPRSPLVAGLLSTVVPGMGHFYLGQTRAGLTGLLLTGGLGTATALFAADRQTGAALLLGAATLTSWVFAVIFSARSARRMARRQRDERTARWRSAYAPQVELVSSDDLVLQATPAR